MGSGNRRPKAIVPPVALAKLSTPAWARGPGALICEPGNRGSDAVAKKPARDGGEVEAMTAISDARLREAFSRIETQKPPRRLVDAFDRLLRGLRRTADPRN